jgi:hypothetical protein
MAQWIGICGVRLAPLADALKHFILSHGVIHADETPVALLAPGRGKTKKAYVWVYRTTNFVAQRAVLFDFAASRGGEHPRRVLQGFGGTLVSDDYSGYHALQAQCITAALCMAHARRKLFEAHQLNGSQIAGQAVALIAKLYEIEREARELEPQARWLLRQQRSRPVAEALHTWLSEQRQKLAKADPTAKAIDYSLSNWRALTRYLDDGNVPIDNNAAENAVRPLCVGRNNANCSFMRTCRRSPRERRGVPRRAAARARSGLRIRAGVSCGGNPTSGDFRACIRVHSFRASGVAARQRSRAVRTCLRASPGRPTLRGQHGAHIRIRRGALRALDAPLPRWRPRRCQ